MDFRGLFFRACLYLPAPLAKGLRKRVFRSFWRSELARYAKSEPISHSLGDQRRASDKGLEGSERATLLEATVEFPPLRSLLEVGCSYGQNFISLAELFPEIELLGIDSDSDVAFAGQLYFATHHPTRNIQLIQGTIPDCLSEIGKEEYDVVLSSAFLLYVPEEKLKNVLQEMLRIARYGILLLEQSDGDLSGSMFHPSTGGTPGTPEAPGYWVHNMEGQLETLLPRENITCRRIESPRWEFEHWAEFGKVIIVRKN